MEFYVEYEKGYDEPYFIKEKETGWFFPLKEEKQANNLATTLNELHKPREPQTIEGYYEEWERAINEANAKTKTLLDIKETYTQMEQDIIDNTDFKELYGANNQKVRDNHVKNELKDLVDERHDLELRIEYLKMRIGFIKSVLSMQRALIDSGGL